MSLRIFAIFLILLAAASLIRLLAFTPAVVWDGWFDLLVRVSSSSGKIKSVTCEVFQTKEQAEKVSEFIASGEFEEPFSRWTVRAPQFTGDPIEVQVPVSGTEAICGRTLTRTQFQCLVVTGELASGRRVKKLAQIPDGRVSREVLVELP
jgi:hypothetical protein